MVVHVALGVAIMEGIAAGNGLLKGLGNAIVGDVGATGHGKESD